MNEPQKPSKLRIAVSIGLPALTTTVFALIAVFAAAEQSWIYIGPAGASMIGTVLMLLVYQPVLCGRQPTVASESRAKGFPGWAAPIMGCMLGGILLGALSLVGDQSMQQATIAFVLVGALQGFVAGLVVWSRDEKRQRNRSIPGKAACR